MINLLCVVFDWLGGRVRAPGAWKVGVWFAGAAFFGWAEFGAAYWTVSAIAALFTIGVGTRKPGELSAYSVSCSFTFHKPER